MILYFTGTGNSEYVSKKIEEDIQYECRNLFKRIQTNDNSEIKSSLPWVIVCPTYAWRIPRILETYLLNTQLTGSHDIYFVMTCGENIGNAQKYCKDFCDKKGLNLLGVFPVVMPENYIAMFDTPSFEKSIKIIQKANPMIHDIATKIKNRETYFSNTISKLDKIYSGPTNTIFYKQFVHAKKFRVKDSCISCGKCVNVCPCNNIQLIQGKPVWNNTCTHCMACISYCPMEAIEYGNKSVGKRRYTFPKG